MECFVSLAVGRFTAVTLAGCESSDRGGRGRAAMNGLFKLPSLQRNSGQELIWHAVCVL